jgi:hypothetical protein
MRLELLINPEDQRTFGPCECCGNMTQRVWGYVNQGDATIAAYFVEWTPGHVQNPANFDQILVHGNELPFPKIGKQWR